MYICMNYPSIYEGSPSSFPLDLSNPLTLLIAFLLFDIVPSVISSVIFRVAGIEIEYLTGSDMDRRIFTLYPLYPVFLPFFKHGYTILTVSAWLVFFFPFFEEILFYAVPSMYGFMFALFAGIAWAMIHVVRIVSWTIEMGYSKLQALTGFVASLITYLPHAYIAALLWSTGLGFYSILFHMLHNSAYILSRLTEFRTAEKKIEGLIEGKYSFEGKYYHVRLRRKYFKISSWEE